MYVCKVLSPLFLFHFGSPSVYFLGGVKKNQTNINEIPKISTKNLKLGPAGQIRPSRPKAGMGLVMMIMMPILTSSTSSSNLTHRAVSFHCQWSPSTFLKESPWYYHDNRNDCGKMLLTIMIIFDKNLISLSSQNRGWGS